MDIAQNSTLGLVLDNRDRRFSPENEDAANPLAGKIQPLRPVRLTSNDGTTTRTHWSGWVKSVHPALNKYGERLVKILCTGALQFLSSTQTKIGETTKLADLTTYSDFEEGVLTLSMAGDNWARQGGYPGQEKDTFCVYRGIHDVTAAERGTRSTSSTRTKATAGARGTLLSDFEMLQGI